MRTWGWASLLGAAVLAMIVYCATHMRVVALRTETGGLMLFVQYQGPTTGGRPIYEGRFNMTARKPLAEENVEA